MKPDETAASYDKLAAHWASETFNRENGLDQHARALQFVRSRKTALDIGCGSSGRIIDLLLAAGFADVQGLDISTEMLALAQERHPRVVFHHSDICQWEFTKTYDFITAWDSIWHVPLGDQVAVLKKICAALNPGGVLIFTTGGVDEPDEGSNPFQGQPLYHAALGIGRLLTLIDQCQCVCRHLEFDQWPEPHLYLVVQKG